MTVCAAEHTRILIKYMDHLSRYVSRGLQEGDYAGALNSDAPAVYDPSKQMHASEKKRIIPELWD